MSAGIEEFYTLIVAAVGYLAVLVTYNIVGGTKKSKKQ